MQRIKAISPVKDEPGRMRNFGGRKKLAERAYI